MNSVSFPEIGTHVRFEDSSSPKRKIHHGVVQSKTREWCLIQEPSRKNSQEPTFWKYISPENISRVEHQKVTNGMKTIRIPIGNTLSFVKDLFCANCFLTWDRYFPSISSQPASDAAPLCEIDLVPSRRSLQLEPIPEVENESVDL